MNNATVRKLLMMAAIGVLCGDANCLRVPRGGNLLTGLRSRADAEITDQTAAHAKWKTRTRALEKKLDEIEDKLIGRGVQWVHGAAPQDIANAVNAIKLIDGLQRAKSTKTDRIKDLKSTVEDILASLRSYRETLKNVTLRDDFSEIIRILDEEYKEADASYITNDLPADYQ